MASIEYIESRIKGKEKEISKLEMKMARIMKAKETNWTVNPYYYHEDDIRYTEKDLAAAQKALDKYQEDLKAAQEKANSRNIKVIVDFLEAWKERMHNWYAEGLNDYFTDKRQLKEACQKISYEKIFGMPEEERQILEAEYNALRNEFSRNVCGVYENRTYLDKYGKERTVKVKVEDGKYEAFKPYINEDNLEKALLKLDKDLKLEAERKYDFIVERTNAIVGQITDASGLRIGAKDDLNGYIIGTRETAKVQTIGAGGYNIQCFHFRTLINPVK